MSQIDHLASLLAPAVRAGGVAMSVGTDIDGVIETLARRLKAGSGARASEDVQMETVRRFWQRPQLRNLRDARIVAFGMCLPAGPTGACILDDQGRLAALLDGIDQWLDRPRWYRRCYQGLVWAYFNFDVDAQSVSTSTHRNWQRLRDYLLERAPKTLDPQSNPDWVKTVVASRRLFGESPCERYVADMLIGDRDEVDTLCAQLGINDASWFLRRLLHCQVVAATKLGDDEFCALLPSLIEMLAGARTLRDAGLVMLLERYRESANLPMHERLRDAAENWWGSPWSPSGAMPWRGLSDRAMDMVADWLKAHFIERFFARCADGSGNRRAAFWARYAKSIQRVEFHADSMVMTIGCAAVVTSADSSQPARVHDLRKPRPFDLDRAARAEIDADLLLAYRDGLDGWRQWEQMFEAALRARFDIRSGLIAATPKTAFVDLSDMPAESNSTDNTQRDSEPRWHSPSAGEDVHWQTAEAASVPYSRPDLEVFARVHSLRLDDQTTHTGKLWIRADANDRRIARVLTRWGFIYVPREGWSKQTHARDQALA
jgi:hypothetical protein